jgi:drug/metabolite transporter (DMT)-like permease
MFLLLATCASAQSIYQNVDKSFKLPLSSNAHSELPGEMTVQPTHAANLRGIVSMLCAMALFIASDTMVKLAGAMMPPTEIMAVRGLIAVVLMGGIVLATVERAQWNMIRRPLVAARAGLEAVLAVLFLVALPHLPLGEITVIMQIAPLVLTVLSSVVLAETIGWRRWAAVAAGFLGVVLVAQPSGQGINVYILIALIVPVLVAVRDIMTRKLDPKIPTAAVTFTTTLGVCLLGLAGAPLENWTPLSSYALALLAASAALVSGANIFIIRAFRGVDVSVVSPFRYSSVVWAILLGYVIWGDIPNPLAIVGMAIIVASGLYVMHRETLHMRPSKSDTNA